MRDLQENYLRMFDISPLCGFLPEQSPLRRLPNPYYEPWEELLDELSLLLQQNLLQLRVNKLPYLDSQALSTYQEWRRAYVVLGFLVHGYIWSNKQPSVHLPAQLARPLIAVADHLGLPPTGTYSSFNLWNFEYVTSPGEHMRPEDFEVLHTFTGTEDEKWFFAISDALEAGGGPVMAKMLKCNEAARTNDATAVASYLKAMATELIQLGRLLKRMHERCAPEVFYHKIRPFLAGSKGVHIDGSPKGVFYDEGEGKGRWREYSGGSNAQSSTIQFLDIILGVQHFATGDLIKVGLCSDGQDINFETNTIPHKQNGYLMEMRNYMPYRHRVFLNQLPAHAYVRRYVLASPVTEPYGRDLRASYDAAVLALAAFRDVHLQIVARYIIAPSRNSNSSLSTSTSFTPLSNKCKPERACQTLMSTENNVTEEEAEVELHDVGENNINCNQTDLLIRKKQSPLAGTGGTDLIMFLRQTRDETRHASTKHSVPDSA